MKHIKSILISLLVLSLAGCESWIDTEINKDPDAPSTETVSLDVVLPSIEANLAYVLGGADMSGAACVWTQHLEGIDRQFSSLNNYSIQRSFTNNLWNSYYADHMMDADFYIEKSKELNSPHNEAVGNILMAVSLGTLTDYVGDIPYEEAFQGGENLSPKFDSQEEIYNTVFSLLDAAISKLDETDPIGIPSSDYIYGGSAAQWQKVAYALRARYKMHLSAMNDEASYYTDIIGDLDNGITSEAGSFELPFENSTSKANPWWKFNNSRGGYASDNSYYQNLMASYADPRQPLQTNVNGFWSSMSSPVAFMTYAEAEFLRAEAQYRAGNPGDAKTALRSALDASCNKMEVDPAATWRDSIETNVIDPLSGEALLEEIMVQKYLHMFLRFESYVDFRRTGYPALTPVSGDQVPLRFPYPQDELTYNRNAPSDITIYSSLWWDKD